MAPCSARGQTPLATTVAAAPASNNTRYAQFRRGQGCVYYEHIRVPIGNRFFRRPTGRLTPCATACPPNDGTAPASGTHATNILTRVRNSCTSKTEIKKKFHSAHPPNHELRCSSIQLGFRELGLRPLLRCANESDYEISELRRRCVKCSDCRYHGVLTIPIHNH